MSQAVQMCQVPAYCGDGPGAFLSSTCGYQVARPCLCARLPVHVPRSTRGADGHKRGVCATLSVFACAELSSVENLLLR